ncbi:MAG: PAS domain-containing sensor histidine kinase [Bacteroidota bacterium]
MSNIPSPQLDPSRIGIEQMSKALFESAAEGLVVVNARGRIQVTNPRLSELFGYSEGEMIGKTVEFLIPRRYHDTHTADRNTFMKKPGRRSMGSGRDLWARRKDGSEFPVEVSINHFSTEGNPFVMALVTDITTRKQAEKKLAELNAQLESRVQARTVELRDSQRLYSLIARNFPNGTINVFDQHLNYRFVEGRELYQLGVTSEELVGTNYLDRLPESLRRTIRENLLPVFRGLPAQFEVESQGNIYELSAVPLPDDQGEISQILVVEQNISRQKQAERDIRDALDKERQLSELKSRFVSMASHEFRTPLSTILTSVSLVARYTEEKHRDRREKHIERIRSSVQNLTGILNDFLSLDRLETGAVETNPDRFDLREYLRDIVEEMQVIARKEQLICLELHNVGEVMLDAKMLRNILINLISNAIKYSPEGSEIKLSARLTGDTISFSVRDAGMGIPEADQPHLFGRFFRARNATNIQGTGLGLNIVRKFLDLMGGTIYFKSKEGVGTTFYLEIPQTLSI